MRRRKNVSVTYTYEELCEKRNRVGEENLNFTQYIAYKRKEGWTGVEPEEKGYFDLLTDAEFYIHCRRFLKDCICFTCAKCPIEGFWKRLSGCDNECISNLSKEDKQQVKIVKSPEKRFNLVNQCPQYVKANDKRIYYDYIDSPFWKELKNALIEQHQYCEGCGLEKEELGGLVVHHKSYKHLGFEDIYDDCCVLCGPCHMALHKDPERYWDEHSVIIPAHKRKEEQE